MASSIKNDYLKEIIWWDSPDFIQWDEFLLVILES